WWERWSSSSTDRVAFFLRVGLALPRPRSRQGKPYPTGKGFSQDCLSPSAQERRDQLSKVIDRDRGLGLSATIGDPGRDPRQRLDISRLVIRLGRPPFRGSNRPADPCGSHPEPCRRGDVIVEPIADHDGLGGLDLRAFEGLSKEGEIGLGGALFLAQGDHLEPFEPAELLQPPATLRPLVRDQAEPEPRGERPE